MSETALRPDTGYLCPETGHRFVLRKIKKTNDLNGDDFAIFVFLFLTGFGIPLGVIYIWFRWTTTSYYEICEWCGTKINT